MDTVSPHPTVFIGYSHDDETWKDHLVPLLRVFTLEEELEVWDDRRISGGTNWLPEIEAALTRARPTPSGPARRSAPRWTPGRTASPSRRCNARNPPSR